MEHKIRCLLAMLLSTRRHPGHQLAGIMASPKAEPRTVCCKAEDGRSPGVPSVQLPRVHHCVCEARLASHSRPRSCSRCFGQHLFGGRRRNGGAESRGQGEGAVGHDSAMVCTDQLPEQTRQPGGGDAAATREAAQTAMQKRLSADTWSLLLWKSARACSRRGPNTNKAFGTWLSTSMRATSASPCSSRRPWPGTRCFASLFVALEAEARKENPTSLRWRVKPKLHLFQELCEFVAPEQGNPRLFWTYRDEDHGGWLAAVGARRGGKNVPGTTALRIFQRYCCLTELP